MLIFNLPAVAQGVVALIPAVLLGLFFGVLGFTSAVLPLLVFVGGLAAIDGLWRLAASGPRVDEDGIETAGRGWWAMVHPRAGGHLFFVPNWLSGGAVTVLLSYAGIVSLFQ